MLHQISVGLTALRAAQIGLNVVGQNLANANTPGYHRQSALFVDRDSFNWYGLEQGSGVDVNRIRRAQASVVERALLQYTSDQSQVASQLEYARQIESIFQFRNGSLPDEINELFNRLEELSARPDEQVSRQDVIRTAQKLVTAIQRNTLDMDRMATSITAEVEGMLDRINGLTREITDLNGRIRNSKLQGRQPNDLLDRRTALVSELSTLVDVQVNEAEDTVILGGGAVLVGASRPPQLELRRDDNGWAIYRSSGQSPVEMGPGSVAAALTTLNETLPGYGEELDRLAWGLIETFDSQHARGVGLGGAFDMLIGQRTVADVDAPLASLDGALQITAGRLTLSRIDEATGLRTLHPIDIDPELDTLRTVADKISQIPNLQGIVDPQRGGLSIVAESGYRFDFTGLPQDQPDVSGLSGTSVPSVAGVYQGADNDTYSFVFSGAGQIGVTDGLQIELRDGSGQFVETLNIGAGYTPGSTLEFANGLQVSLTSGTVVAGESFAVDAVAQADETGFLVALGINTFFTGNNARTLQVSAEISAAPDRLAASLSGQPGDSINLTRMIDSRDRALALLDNRSARDFTYDLTAQVGSDVLSLNQAKESLEIVGANLEAQYASVTGVDPDEEVAQMLVYQRSYEAAARYLTTINQTTEELMLLIR